VVPNQGGRGTIGRGGSGSTSGITAARRLSLLIFGVAFVLLFVIVAVAEGLGDPDVPSGDIAVIEEAPDGSGEITDAKFKHALDLVTAQLGLKEAPKPSDPQYEDAKEEALKSLFESAWVQGLAEERGVTAGDKELDRELQKAIDESFGGSKAKFNEFLKEAHYTPADVDEQVRRQVLTSKLQKELEEEVPEPSEDEIEDYYEAAKSAQFTQEPTRDVRLILNSEEEKAEKAIAKLEGSSAPASWNRVAKEFSDDPSTKELGGMKRGVGEGSLEEPLEAAVLEAPVGKLEGPIKTREGFYVFEVDDTTPEIVQPLEDVESQIASTLASQLKEEFFAAFVADFQLQWQQRTFCAPGYVTEQCANFGGDAHPEGAVPACYEEDPKEGLPEEGCPAPVFQLMPALPGSVTPLEPKGKPMAQRPQPVPGEQTEEAAAVPAPLE
jgi:parvulin-like peptidyl-prolyl isomerase